MAGTDHLLLPGSVVRVQLAVSLSNGLGGSAPPQTAFCHRGFTDSLCRCSWGDEQQQLGRLELELPSCPLGSAGQQR